MNFNKWCFHTLSKSPNSISKFSFIKVQARVIFANLKQYYAIVLSSSSHRPLLYRNSFLPSLQRSNKGRSLDGVPIGLEVGSPHTIGFIIGNQIDLIKSLSKSSVLNASWHRPNRNHSLILATGSNGFHPQGCILHSQMGMVRERPTIVIHLSHISLHRYFTLHSIFFGKGVLKLNIIFL